MIKKIIDTNLIIRYLVNDNLRHYKKAKEFFDLVKPGKVRAILEQTVFTETIYVLSRIYLVPKEEIVSALCDLLNYKGIFNSEKNVLFTSLEIYSNTNLHIVDCILAAKSRLEKIEIQTFDQELNKY